MVLASNFSNNKVIILHEQTPIFQAARAMCDQNFGYIVVCDQRHRLVGILTDRDLACSSAVISIDRNWLETPILEIMTENPIAIDENSEIKRAADLMEENAIRRLPIVHKVSENIQKCIGVVTLDDLIVSKLIDTDQVVRIISAQLGHSKGQSSKRKGRFHSNSRSEARSEQTVNHFYKHLAKRAGYPIGDSFIQITHFLVGSLVKRIHYQGAANFVAQLPRALQDDLLDLPAGPDRKITQTFLVQSLTSKYGLPQQDAETLLHNFYSSFPELIDPKEIEHVKAQLPPELRELFSNPSNPSQKTAV